VGFCKYNNEISGSIKFEEFLDFPYPAENLSASASPSELCSTYPVSQSISYAAYVLIGVCVCSANVPTEILSTVYVRCKLPSRCS
jgi:hypothetical protein